MWEALSLLEIGAEESVLFNFKRNMDTSKYWLAIMLILHSRILLKSELKPQTNIQEASFSPLKSMHD